MYNITLINTRHDEAGKSNSNELYKIIENLCPELIFEELPPSSFDKHYISKTRSSLETDTINKYLETNKVEHLLIDSDKIPPESFFQDHRYLHEEIERLSDINGSNYRRILDGHKSYSEMYGFQYLNSIHCIDLYDKLNDTIEKALQKLNSAKFFEINSSWHEWNERRENEMLQNIYSYSKDHSFNNAIFTLGAAHRKSIIKKIENYEENEKSGLNWQFYGG